MSSRAQHPAGHFAADDRDRPGVHPADRPLAGQQPVDEMSGAARSKPFASPPKGRPCHRVTRPMSVGKSTVSEVGRPKRRHSFARRGVDDAGCRGSCSKLPNPATCCQHLEAVALDLGGDLNAPAAGDVDGLGQESEYGARGGG